MRKEGIMQLKTCTNPDRIMKYRHKILHSRKIAFSHVLWFEKKRRMGLRDRWRHTGRGERERGKKKKRQRQGESQQQPVWSPTELRRGSGLPCLGLRVCRRSALPLRLLSGQKGSQETSPHPHPNLGVWGFFSVYIFVYFVYKHLHIFCICN